MDNLRWYCETSRDHQHQSQWESENCSELYDLWQEALYHLMSYVREDEVEAQVNAVLLEDGEEGDADS